MQYFPKTLRACLSLAAIALTLVSGCSPKAGETVVANVGQHTITLADYENMYIKSNGTREQAAAATQEEREKFLGLVTNFRLKLTDAYNKGMQTRPEILKEIQQYKGSLAASYLTDREVTSPGTRMMYERRTEEVRASHILINLAPDAPASDSAAAYAKAYEVIGKLKAGANFAAVAAEYSQDPSVKQNNGDLYYFTGGQMVPSFEDAVFAMKVGEITSAPIRTQYGLHIIKAVDRKPAPGEVQCSHIMIRFEKQDPSPEDTLKAFEKIKLIQDSIKLGIDFAELATRNSGDPGSAQRGGDLGLFGRRRWIQSFDEVALAMKPGEVSGIVRTIYGYHIIKCTDRKPAKAVDEAKKEAQQLYQQVRFQDDNKKYMAKLKSETRYAINDSVAKLFIASVDTTETTKDSTWTKGITPELGGAQLYSIGGRPVSVDSFVTLLQNRPDMTNTPLRPASIRSAFDKIGDQLIFDFKSETIEKDYPEFAAIMKEYTDGILLYQIEQEQVWNRISVSDSALRAYHEINKDKFRFPDRVKFTGIRVASDSLAIALHEQLVSGRKMEDLAREDSLRMRLPATYRAVFASRSSSLSKSATAALASAAEQLKSDTSIKLNVIAYYDTGKGKITNEKLAKARLDAMKNQLVKKLGVTESRITASSRIPAKSLADTAKKAMFGRADVEITGRRPKIMGGIEHGLLPVDADDRTQHADSLIPGAYSLPFMYEGSAYIVRLETKDPAHTKTFDEAGTEVSSSFQEFESKRLEREWLEGLRKAYPVIEHKEALKNAFAPVQ